MFCVIKELQDLFVDACVRDPDGHLMFLSVYGRDGSIQQLMAAIHLGGAEGGLRSITLVDPSTRRDLLPVSIGDRDRLTRFTGRLPKENLFGNLTQAWIYDPEIMQPSRGTGTGWILIDERSEPDAVTAAAQRERIWQMYQQLSTVPLPDHWRDTILDATPGYVFDLSAPPLPIFGRVRAWKIAIHEEFPALVSQLVSRRELMLDPEEELAIAS
jgi:hypothetical protein